MNSRVAILTVRNLALVFLALAAVKFAVRGPMRTVFAPFDFAPVYAQSLGWCQGIQPYDGDEVAALLQGTECNLRDPATLIYPISNSVILAPLASLPWPAACVAWRVLGVALICLQFAALVSCCGLRWTETRAIFLFGLLFGLASSATGLSSGQPSIPSVCCGVLSLCFLKSGRLGWAGVLIGIATAIKPQIGAPFLIYYFLNRNWRPMLVGLGTLAMVYAIGYLRLIVAGVNLAEAWELWLPRVTYVAGHGDSESLFTQDARYNLINLHALLICFWQDNQVVSKTVLATGFVALVAMSALIWTRTTRNGDFIGAGAVCVLSLLGAYHYHYDSLLLTVPIAGAFVAIGRPNQKWAWGIVLASIPFLVPGPSTMLYLTRQGLIPDHIADSLLWQCLVSHQIWALLVILGFLFVGLRRQERTGTLMESLNCLWAGTRA
jgi:hypothetical protein